MNNLRILLSCGLIVSTSHTYPMYNVNEKNKISTVRHDYKGSLVANSKQLLTAYGIGYLTTSSLGQTIKKGFEVTNEYNAHIHPLTGYPAIDRMKYALCKKTTIQSPLLRSIGERSMQASTLFAAPFRSATEIAILPFYFMAQFYKTAIRPIPGSSEILNNEILLERSLIRRGMLWQTTRPIMIGLVLPLAAMHLYQQNQ